MSDKRYVYLEDAEVKARTVAAVLVAVGGEEHWIPLSQVAADDRDGLGVGDGYTIPVTRWICEQKGIECYTEE